MIGIEPSAILTFRDEYIDLADDDKFETAKELSKNVFTIDEFIAAEIEKGNISVLLLFTKEKRTYQIAWSLPAKSIVVSYRFSKEYYLFPKIIQLKQFLQVVAVWPGVLVMKKNIMIFP